MRLLVYTDSTTVGGAEVAVGYLLRGLDARIEVGVLAVDRTVGEAIASNRGGTQVAIVRPASGTRDVAAVRRHASAIRAFAPDIVHANHTWPLDCACAELAAELVPKAKLVAVHHLPLESAVPRLRRLAGNVLARRVDAHVAVGERAARTIERYLRLPAGTVRAVPNGVPSPPVAGSARDADGLAVGALGRLTEQKRLYALVRALAALPRMVLTLVGDGPQRAMLEALARELEVADRLEITGWVSDPTSWLARLDVLALPSGWEGMPLAILEAMHAGLPVVASDVGSVAEAVSDGVTGYLVAPGDDRALNDRLARLGADPLLRRRLGEEGRRVAAAQFTIETMARRYESVYREALDGGARTPAAAVTAPAPR